jgi:transketolase
MRNAFIQAVLEIAENDQRVVFLTGDLGFTVLEPLAEKLQDRFINVGVAEQNMVGLATGLAEAGFVPYVYSIGTFASMRPYEFIRNGPLLHLLPVRVIGVGAGLDYGHNGVTHYALEDIAIMRAQPDMTIIAPADSAQAVSAAYSSTAIAGPIYFRIGKTNVPVDELDGSFELGRLNLVGEGQDVAIVALGSLAGEAVAAQKLLEGHGVNATVAVVSSVQPAPVDDLVGLLEGVPLVVTVEAHYRNGGLGSLVAEVIAEHGLACRLQRRAIEVMPRGVTGTLTFLNDVHGLSAGALAEWVLLLRRSASTAASSA